MPLPLSRLDPGVPRERVLGDCRGRSNVAVFPALGILRREAGHYTGLTKAQDVRYVGEKSNKLCALRQERV